MVKSLKPVLFAAAFLLSVVLHAQEDTLRFAFITDLHYASGSHSVNDLHRCIADINAQEGLDFVLAGGDLTDFGTDEEIAAVKQMLDSLRYTYYVVAGNHDAKWSESGCNTFKNVFGYENFEFRCKGWRFIGCNCGPDMRMAPALIPRESMEWLKGLEPDPQTVFVNHYPQDSSVLNYFEVTRELKRLGTQWVLGGHWHANTRLNYDGLPGALGRSTLSAGKAPGYNIVTLTKGEVKMAERRIIGGTAVQLEPWYAEPLQPVRDTVSYDADGLPSGYPWMRYGVNASAPVKPLWERHEDSNIVAGFARDDKRAWFTTASGSVRCISLKDGRQLWSKSFPGKIFSTPALDGKYLVFGCTDGTVYALNPRNGRLRWKTAFGKSVLGSPVARDGKVYVGASDGTFRALDLQTGAPVWSFSEVEGFVECRAWVDAQQVVFGSWANKLYSLDPRTGALQWVWSCKKPSRMYSPAATWPVKADGKIFIAVPDRRIYVIDAASGEELKYFEKASRESIALSPDGRTAYGKSMYHSVWAVDTHSLDVRWVRETGAGYDISPTPMLELPGVGVIMPTDKGNLVCFRDGERVWAYKLSLALVNPMEGWTDPKDGSVRLLVSTMDGVVSLLKIER